jgi:F0F1-type ATP synthase assembly protein I
VVTGFANTGGFISAILLPFFFGKILDSFLNTPDPIIGYHYGLIIPVLFAFMGLIGSFMIKEKKRNKQSSIKTTGTI